MRRLLLVCLLALAGCATELTMPTKASRLVPGQTTMNEAIALLGPPVSRSNLANGLTSLVWTETNSMGFNIKAASVAVLFDASGRMVRVAHESNRAY